MKNKLYIVATPIGNIEDFTFRAVNILKKSLIIFCEDTVYSKKLLDFYNIQTKTSSLNLYNEEEKNKLIKSLLEKGDVAIISDAGTPCISDPGQITVHKIKNETNHLVVPIPGVSSVVTFLSASGALFKNFTFLGFAPKKKNKLIEVIEQNMFSDLIIFFESPKRIIKTFEIINDVFGNIDIYYGRELTKIYEEIRREKVTKLLTKTFKGEIVFAIPTNNIVKKNSDDWISLLNLLQQEKISNKTIIKIITRHYKVKKNDLYQFLK